MPFCLLEFNCHCRLIPFDGKGPRGRMKDASFDASARREAAVILIAGQGADRIRRELHRVPPFEPDVEGAGA